METHIEASLVQCAAALEAKDGMPAAEHLEHMRAMHARFLQLRHRPREQQIRIVAGEFGVNAEDVLRDTTSTSWGR